MLPRQTVRIGLTLLALIIHSHHEAISQSLAPQPATGEQRATSCDPFFTLNDAFRAAYRRERGEVVERCGPVVLVEGDNLVLTYGLHRTEVRVVPESYHILKTISHVPLGLYLLLVATDEEKAISDSRLYDLRQYRGQIMTAEKALAKKALTDGQQERQKRILHECLTFLDGVLERKRLERKELTSFASLLRPLIKENTQEAARVQIDALHRQMSIWQKQLTDQEWKAFHVVIMGPALPRKENLAVQYFARLLGEPGEGRRIIYAESLYEEARALELLGTHLVDTGIGTTFFDDPQRMKRDLLSDAAKEYLAHLFAKAKP